MNKFLVCLAVLLQLPEFQNEVSQFEIRMLRSLVAVRFGVMHIEKAPPQLDATYNSSRGDVPFKRLWQRNVQTVF